MNQDEPFLGSYKVRKWDFIVCFSIQLCPQIHSCMRVCMRVLQCMHVQPQRAGASRDQKKTVESLETGVTGACQTPDVGIGSCTQVLYEKSKHADC